MKMNDSTTKLKWMDITISNDFFFLYNLVVLKRVKVQKKMNELIVICWRRGNTQNKKVWYNSSHHYKSKWKVTSEKHV